MLARRWRWAVALALASMVPWLTPRTIGGWLPALTFVLAIAGGEALAFGAPGARQLRWAALTAIGVVLSFPFAYVAGIAVFLVIALPPYLLHLQGDTPATVALALALVAGGAAAGAFVGFLQAGLVRSRRAWVTRSACAGVFMLPAAIGVFSGASDLTTEGTALAAGIAASAIGGAICGFITAGDPTVSNSLDRRAQLK